MLMELIVQKIRLVFLIFKLQPLCLVYGNVWTMLLSKQFGNKSKSTISRSVSRSFSFIPRSHLSSSAIFSDLDLWTQQGQRQTQLAVGPTVFCFFLWHSIVDYDKTWGSGYCNVNTPIYYIIILFSYLVDFNVVSAGFQIYNYLNCVNSVKITTYQILASKLLLLRSEETGEKAVFCHIEHKTYNPHIGSLMIYSLSFMGISNMCICRTAMLKSNVCVAV